MAKKNNLLDWAAVIGGAGVLYYLYNKNKAATVATPITTPVISPITTLPVSTTVSVLDPGITQPVTVTATPESLVPIPISSPTNTATHSANQQKVIDYFTSDLDEANLNQFHNSMGLYTPEEWAGLYDLLVNDWEGGGGNTPARKQFWDTWRVKYHILDGTYN